MTDNEIIKALECCGSKGLLSFCDDCPYCEGGWCINKMPKDTLDLINRQKAEIERLREENFLLSQKRANMFEILKAYEQGKADAIKEKK